MACRERKLIFGTRFRFCDHLTRSRHTDTGPNAVVPDFLNGGQLSVNQYEAGNGGFVGDCSLLGKVRSLLGWSALLPWQGTLCLTLVLFRPNMRNEDHKAKRLTKVQTT